MENSQNDGPWLCQFIDDPYLNLDDETFDDLDVKTFVNNHKTESILRDRQGPPDRGDFGGDYNFSVVITPDTRRKYEYSINLEKVYIQLATELPVFFSWDWSKRKRQYPGDLIIRATLQFADLAETERRPIRCFNHNSTKIDLNRDVPDSMLAHVLQSVLKDGDGGVEYCGFAENERSWLSVCIKPPMDLAPGVEMFSHTYKFMCKNSCASGINRRAVEVAFTLEDYLGNILGRHTIGVRVCSCPKRDMGKDEQNQTARNQAPKKPRLSSETRPSNKVLIKGPNVDLTPFDVNFRILGKRNYDTVLNLAMGLMRADANKLHPATNQATQTPHDVAIKSIMQKLSQPTEPTKLNNVDADNHNS